MPYTSFLIMRIMDQCVYRWGTIANRAYLMKLWMASDMICCKLFFFSVYVPGARGCRAIEDLGARVFARFLGGGFALGSTAAVVDDGGGCLCAIALTYADDCISDAPADAASAASVDGCRTLRRIFGSGGASAVADDADLSDNLITAHAACKNRSQNSCSK